MEATEATLTRPEARKLLNARAATRLPLTTLTVLNALINQSHMKNPDDPLNSGAARTSPALLARRIGKGMSPRTAQRHIDKLEEENLITIRKEGKHTMYTVTLETMLEWETNRAVEEAKIQRELENHRARQQAHRAGKVNVSLKESSNAQVALSTLIAHAVFTGSLPERVFETA